MVLYFEVQVHVTGLEPATFRLRGDYSTIELHMQIGIILFVRSMGFEPTLSPVKSRVPQSVRLRTHIFQYEIIKQWFLLNVR